MEEVECSTENTLERGWSELEGGASEFGVTEVLRMFTEDCQQDEEQAEEKQAWETTLERKKYSGEKSTPRDRWNYCSLWYKECSSRVKCQQNGQTVIKTKTTSE